MPQGKKRKQPKNAFYFFMVHFRSKEEAKGVRFPGGFKEVADKAAPIWKRLTSHEKCIYEEEARKRKEEDKLNLETKYTSQGKSYAEVEREKNEAIDQLNKMNQEIERTVRSLNYWSSLRTYPFHLMHVNYYCRQENGNFTPCEIAVAEFSFLEGIKKVYHTLINPGNIPLGYRFEAVTHSQKTHQIPVPPEEFGGERDYVKILYDIKRFLVGSGRDMSSMPPLYTRPNCEAAVKNVLWGLQDCVQLDTVNAADMFRVYSLPKLFYELRNACVPDKPGAVGFPVFCIAEDEIERDVYDFGKGISCEFHEDTDAKPHCSLSSVRRWGFLIMDHCCKDLGIQLVPGQHCCIQADTSPVSKEACQSSSTHSTLEAAPEIVTVKKQPGPRKLASPEPLERLRRPRTDSLAISLMKEEDFPSLGSSKQSKPAGVMTKEPVAMAGRARLSTRLAYPIGIGRGRGRPTDWESDFKNMQVN